MGMIRGALWQELGVSFILTIYNERPDLRVSSYSIPRHVPHVVCSQVDARTTDWLFLEAHDSEKQDLCKLFDRAVI